MEKVSTITVINNHSDGTTDTQTAVQTTKTSKRTTEPPYVKLYLNTIAAFNDIKGKGTMAVFLVFLYHMTYAKEEQIVNTNGMIDIFCDEADIKRPTYYRAVDELLKKGLIKKVRRGIFSINPRYAGKGDWRDISTLIAHFNFITGDVTVDFGYDNKLDKLADEQGLYYLSDTPMLDEESVPF